MTTLKAQDEGSAAAETGKISTALQLWERAIRLTPDRAALHEQKAQVFLDLDRTWDAVQCAERATQLQPDWADAFLTLGRAQLGLGEPEQEEAQNELSEVRALVLKRKCDSASVSKRLKTL